MSIKILPSIHETYLNLKKGDLGGKKKVLVLHCKTRHVGKQTWVRGNEAARQGSDFERGGGEGGVEGGGWWVVKGCRRT